MNKKWLVYTLKVIFFCLFMSATASQSPSLDSDSVASSDGISSIESGLEQEVLITDVVIAEKKMAALRAQAILILEKLKNVQALLQIDPSDEAARLLVGNLAYQLSTLKEEAKKIDADLGQDLQEITLIMKALPKKPKTVKVGKPLTVPSDSGKITISQIPVLRLQTNSFGNQAQLSHHGEPLKKHVAGLLTYFPYEVSPARGVILSSNGWLKKQWEMVEKNGNQDHLIKKLFNGLDGQIVKTHLGGNPAMGLSPEIIGQLVRIISIDTALLLQLDDAFFKNWHISYMNIPMPEKQRQLKNYKDYFKKEANRFLKILAAATENGKQEAIDALLCYLMMEREDAGVIVAGYARGLAIEYVPVYFTDRDYDEAKNNVCHNRLTAKSVERHLEQLLFFVNAQAGLDKYITYDLGSNVTYQGIIFPACKEIVLRQIINLIFYNPKIDQLDVQMLPKKLQGTLSEGLREFISMHGDKAAPDKEAMKNFLNLIEGRGKEGICYKGGIYEITGEIGNATTVLKILFGIQQELPGSASEQFEQLLHLLFDDEKRAITVTTGLQGWNFSLDCGGDFRSGIIFWSGQHAYLDLLDNDAIRKGSLLFNLYLASACTGTFLPGMRHMGLPYLLKHLIDDSLLTTKADFTVFFDNNTSQFTKKIPEVFNDDEAGWFTFFMECSEEIASNIMQAICEIDFVKQYTIGFFGGAISAAIEKRDFGKVNNFMAQGLRPIKFFIDNLSLSDFSADQKRALISTLIERASDESFNEGIVDILPYLKTVSLLETKDDFIAFFKNNRNRFGDKFSDHSMATAWRAFFWNYGLSDEEITDVADAAIETGITEDWLWNLFIDKSNANVVRKLIDQQVVLSRKHLIMILKSFFSEEKKIELVKNMLDRGLDHTGLVEDCVAADVKNFDSLKENGVDLNCANSDGLTPLMVAAYQRKADVFKGLVSAGADLEVCNSNGKRVHDVLLEGVEKSKELLDVLKNRETFKVHALEYASLKKLLEMMKVIVERPDTEKQELEAVYNQLIDLQSQAETRRWDD